MLKKFFFLLLVFCLAFNLHALKGNTSDTISKSYLVGLSLEELLDLNVNIGTVTPSTLNNIPVSATIISKEDIEMTPARNILDLIEVYVPGATFTNHWLGPRLGIRGVSGDQNTSYLLLLNGQNINMKTHNGPFYEIQNRDLNDIESIEIIRGPGSVTYGHGAIGGIINIKTLPDTITEKLQAGVGANGYYRYGNVFLKGGLAKDKWSLGYYTSINRSLGEKTPEYFYIDRAHGYGYGFMGLQWGNKGKGTPSPNFYGDYMDEPQVKAQLNFSYGDNLNIWARYSDITFIKQSQLSNSTEGYVSGGLLGKQFISVIEYKPVLTQWLNVSNNLGFLSQSNRDIALYNIDDAPIDDITQRNYSYSQNEVFYTGTLNFNLGDKLYAALGADLDYLYLAPEWGMGKEDFINSYPSPLRFAIYDTVASGFYQQYGSGTATYIEDKIDAYQYSIFSEIKYAPVSYLSILLSGRMDKHEFSDFAFSPRVAVVSKLNDKHTIKAIAQQAVRFPTLNELYAFNYYQDENVEPEIKKGVEGIYQYLITNSIYFETSVYYNSIDQIAWTSAGYPDVVGRFDLLGADLELKYKTEKTTGSVNYSFIHQQKWEPASSTEAYLTNIGIDSINVALPNYGVNRINNLPQHSLKFNLNHTFFNKFRFHGDARVCWGYGQTDMLNSFSYVHENYGTEITQEQMDRINEILDEYGYGKPSVTSNFALSFTPGFLPSSEIYFYAMNLFQYNHIRYVYQYWEEGNNRQYPRQVGFVKEPATISIKWILYVG